MKVSEDRGQVTGDKRHSNEEQIDSALPTLQEANWRTFNFKLPQYFFVGIHD